MGGKSTKFFLKVATIKEIFLFLTALSVFASHSYVPLSLELQGCLFQDTLLFLLFSITLLFLHHLEAVVQVLPNDI